MDSFITASFCKIPYIGLTWNKREGGGKGESELWTLSTYIYIYL